MSTCRFSCDDFHRDLYVYATGQGWTLHVADSRLPDDWPRTQLRGAPRQPIGIAGAGRIFNEPDAAHAFARMTALWRAGFRIPPEAIAEMADIVATNPNA